MSVRNWIRCVTPDFLLGFYRDRKKQKINSRLTKQAAAGKSYDKEFLVSELKKAGIQLNDDVLVHTALSKIGHLAEGPKTMIEALIEAVGPQGHVLMPTSPNNIYQLDYIKENAVFDVLNSPSKTGAVTECFRLWPKTKRSAHPTEPVSVYGPRAQYYVKEHFGAITPYLESSPFAKLAKNEGKILYIGVTLDNAGTSLHTLEDAIASFKFAVYYPEIFTVTVIDENGDKHQVQTKVHDPKMSSLRKCDQLIPHFKAAGVLEEVKIGDAKALLVDAAGFFKTMVKLYHEKGITMYTPNGEKIQT